MTRPKIAIVWRGDAAARRAATPDNNRLHRVFAELAAVGVDAVPTVYDEAFAEECRNQLLDMDGILVWVNPLQDGRSRQSLDRLLAEVASAGPWVSAHPDAIRAMGTKEVLFRTRHLGWGTDTRLYRSASELRSELPKVLAEGRARVLKQARGNDGQGVWKVEPVTPEATCVRVTEAAAGAEVEELPLADFLASCGRYFANGGFMVDQPFQPRLGDGMIRCYLAGAEVVGFAHQYPAGLLPPGHLRPHAEKRMFDADAADFQTLRRRVEQSWVPQMMASLGLDRRVLPVIWDADFLYGPRTAAGEDSFVLCEINVSSVFAIPDAAPAAIAWEALRRCRERSIGAAAR